ncbi:MAG: ATP-binding protein [Proteobacteria bacterium]|nr:ATP-binding protein [Pseudomonadota bacterium]
MAKNKISKKNTVDKEQPRPAVLYVFMGLPASGKSVLARTWARKHHFSYFNSDVVYEQLAPNQISRQQAKHNPLMTKRTYDALLTFAEQELAAGRTVVLDAFYGHREERARVTKLAVKLKTTPHFALCYCSEKLAQARLTERASGCNTEADAQWQNFKKQQENLESLDDLEPTMVVSINTDAPQEQLLEQLDFAFEKKPPIKIFEH